MLLRGSEPRDRPRRPVQAIHSARQGLEVCLSTRASLIVSLIPLSNRLSNPLSVVCTNLACWPRITHSCRHTRSRPWCCLSLTASTAPFTRLCKCCASIWSCSGVFLLLLLLLFYARVYLCVNVCNSLCACAIFIVAHLTLKNTALRSTGQCAWIRCETTAMEAVGARTHNHHQRHRGWDRHRRQH